MNAYRIRYQDRVGAWEDFGPPEGWGSASMARKVAEHLQYLSGIERVNVIHAISEVNVLHSFRSGKEVTP